MGVRLAAPVLCAVVLLTGCGSASVVRTVVVTATPQPPTATPQPRYLAPGQPGAIELVSVTADSNQVQQGGTATLTFTVDNRAGSPQRTVLGASVYSEQVSQNVFSDPPHDVIVTASPGTHTYTRQFSFPLAASGQTFDLLASVDNASFTKVYAESRFPGLLSVAGTDGPAPTPTPPPAINVPPASAPGYGNDGSFADAATGMEAKVAQPQTVEADYSLPAGYTLVAFYVTLTNTDVQPHDYNPLDFSCIDDGHQVHDTLVILPSPYSDAELDSGAMGGGDSRAGWVGCEVPADSKLRIMWDDSSNLSPPVNVWPGEASTSG